MRDHLERSLMLTLAVVAGCGGEVVGEGGLAGGELVLTGPASSSFHAAAADGRPQVVYVSFDGVTLAGCTDWDCDDATSNHSYALGRGLGQSSFTFGAYGGNRQHIVDRLQQVFSPYNVVFTTTRPPSGPFSMVVISPSNPGGMWGMTPLDCGNGDRHNVSLVFKTGSQGGDDQVWRSAAHELAHGFGLGHSTSGSDIMQWASSGRQFTASAYSDFRDCEPDQAVLDGPRLLRENLGPAGAQPSSTGGADLVALAMSHTGTHRTEVHRLSRASNYQSFSMQVGTALGEVSPSQFVFALGDYNRDGVDDLMAIAMNNTGSGRTEMHILSGASNFQSFLLQIPTALGPVTASQFKFLTGDYDRDGIPDLVAIALRDTGSKRTEVHILSGASAYRQFIVQIATPLGMITDLSTSSFGMGDYDRDGLPDLYFLALANTGTRTTEVHVLSGASLYRQFIVQTGTLLGMTSSNSWSFAVVDYDRDSVPDLMAITQYVGTGSRRTEVHVLSGAAGYRQWLMQTGTALGETSQSQFAFVAR